MTQLVGQAAPEFTADAVIGGQIVKNFSLSQYKGKNVVFFFYPLDFTFVCPTELHAFQDALEDFKARNTELIACSVDSAHAHLAWLRTPKSKGGIEGITYPIVSDINKEVAEKFSVLLQAEGIALRGLFLIDQKGIIRHQVVNDLPLGRSVNEVLRMVDALTFHEQNGEVCPANWNTKKKALEASTKGLESYFNSQS